MADGESRFPDHAHSNGEMAVLRRFVRDITWTGEIEPGQLGENSPRMTARGEGAHHLIQDGCWIVGDYEQTQFLPDGSPAVRWQMHMVCGWSPIERCYVAVTADSSGRALAMEGSIEGDVLTFRAQAGGMQYRLTWHASGPDLIVWRNEVSADGKSWTLVESYRCTPITGRFAA